MRESIDLGEQYAEFDKSLKLAKQSISVRKTMALSGIDSFANRGSLSS
jgi:hypothetical protein